MNRRRLLKELRMHSSSKEDVKSLASFAEQLSATELPHLTQRGRERIESRLPVTVQPSRPLYKSPLVLGFTSSFAVCLVIITVVAQSAPSTSPLYNIKRGTDFIRSLWSGEKSQNPSGETDHTIEDMQPSTRSQQPELQYIPNNDQKENTNTEESSNPESDRKDRTGPWRSRKQRDRESNFSQDRTDRNLEWLRWSR